MLAEWGGVAPLLLAPELPPTSDARGILTVVKWRITRLMHRRQEEAALALAQQYQHGKMMLVCAARTGRMDVVESLLLADKRVEISSDSAKQVAFVQSLMPHSPALAAAAAMEYCVVAVRPMEILLPLAVSTTEPAAMPALVQRCLWQLARRIVSNGPTTEGVLYELKKVERSLSPGMFGALVFCVVVLRGIVVHSSLVPTELPGQPVARLWIALASLQRAEDVLPLLDRFAALGLMSEMLAVISLMPSDWPGLQCVMRTAAANAVARERVLALLSGFVQNYPTCPVMQPIAGWFLTQKEDIAADRKLLASIVRHSTV